MSLQFLQDLQKDMYAFYGYPNTEETRILCAAVILQEVFLLFRQATWQSCIKTPAETDNTEIPLDDSAPTGRRGGLFVPFPHDLVADSHEKVAILTTSSWYCMGHMKKLIEQLFAGMDVTIKEVKVRLFKSTRRTTVCPHNLTIKHIHNDHWIFRVTAHSTGKQWAIDITGPQHGIFLPSYYWDLYREKFTRDVLTVKPLGTLARHAAWTSQLKCTMGLTYDVQGKVMKAFHAKVDSAMAKKRRSWSDLLTRDIGILIRHKDQIFKVGKKAIEEYIADQHLRGRRLKAERYEKRHPDEVIADREALYDQFLADYDADSDIIALL